MLSGHISAVILASGSRSRAAMLSASGLDIQIQPAELDETSVKNACRDQGKSVDFVAAQLAREKAAAISATNEDVYVIGADQMLDCDGQWLDKPPDLEAAAAALRRAREDATRLRDENAALLEAKLALEKRFRSLASTVELADAGEGTLRQQLLYPTWVKSESSDFEDAAADDWRCGVSGCPPKPSDATRA